ncbi:MAG: hypothetical protein M3441_09830 [Chloroflexota bacterium]|nr:hypothetical protein [Chloroflexota bacterium]
MPKSTELLPRIVLGLWLALFFLLGFQTLFSRDYPASTWPWMGYLVYSLILGVPLLVVAFQRVADLGIVRLTVCAGFLIVFSYHLFDLVHDLNYGRGWFWMYVRLQIGMFGDSESFNWLQAVLEWSGNLDWIRIITYTGVGYLAARHKGLLAGIAASMLVGTVDSTFGWLVFLPDDGDFEAPALSFILEYQAYAVVRAVFIQAGILAVFGLLGGLIQRLDRPAWPRHHVHVRERRFRPARRIASRSRTG